ncbi:hypothetical protein [Sorangium sp. So ce1151]|uniref:hypothetical protein n=1 Tax=Sorangium sp. So ce1151 TaxID=3133332 RepID=UPI003F5F791B
MLRPLPWLSWTIERAAPAAARVDAAVPYRYFAPTEMGGKLFDFPRMPRDAYLEREADVRRYLDGKLPGLYRIPRYYGDKPDFGDMDVILAAPPDWLALRAEIARDLGITGSKAVGHVFSTSYRGLQTDFFTVPERYLESTYNFFSFNDLGNLIGKLCRRFDLKYGERGLTYVYRREGGNFQVELEITLDFERICHFLGLEYETWRAGFGSLPEMFEWVVASPYFSVAPYLDDTDSNLRKRGRERTTVARFIAWLGERGIDKRVVLQDRRSYLPEVIAAFPQADLAAKIEAERAAEARAAEIAAKFNGKRVMRLVPGLDGKALGELIRAFKASFADPGAFEAWVLSTPEDEIEAHLRGFAARGG